MSYFSDEHVRDALTKISAARRQGQRLEGVAFHPFPARMPLSIAHFLIERLALPNAVVLDPMVGSGTTLVAAMRLGRTGIGLDMDPLAVLLSRTACLPVDPKELESAGERVLAEATSPATARAAMLPHAAPHLEDAERTFADYWFPERSREELLSLASAMQVEPDRATRGFLKVVLSSLVIAKSGGASFAMDLAHSRPHRELTGKVLRPLEEWSNRVRRTAYRLPFRLGERGLGNVEAWQGDARHLGLADNTVDLVLTSPPYLQAIDYIRAHKFALVWLGDSLSHLQHLRSIMIGTKRGLYSPDGLPDETEQTLSDDVLDIARRARLRRYASDLLSALREIERVLKPGAIAVLAISPSMFSTVRHDAADVLAKLARDAGLTVVTSVKRRLNDKRRALPPPQRVANPNSLRRRMKTELFVAVRKPSNSTRRTGIVP